MLLCCLAGPRFLHHFWFFLFFLTCPGMLASPLTFHTCINSCQAKLQGCCWIVQLLNLEFTNSFSGQKSGMTHLRLGLGNIFVVTLFIRLAYFPPDSLALDIFICSITQCEIWRVMSSCLCVGSCHIWCRFITCFTFIAGSPVTNLALLEVQNHVHFGNWWLTVTRYMFCDHTFIKRKHET